MPLQLFQLSPFAPLSWYPPFPPATPTPLFMSMGHTYKYSGYSVSYTVLYIPMAIQYLPICTS